MSSIKFLAVASITLMALYFTGCTQKAKDEKGPETTLHKEHSSEMPESQKMDMDTPAQKICPVMGNPINKDLYVDHNGQRIYVCCQSCVNEVKKDPEKYLKKLEEKGEIPETL